MEGRSYPVRQRKKIPVSLVQKVLVYWDSTLRNTPLDDVIRDYLPEMVFLQYLTVFLIRFFPYKE